MALTCVAVYVTVVALSVMLAHILLILRPESEFAERLILPVARGLEFLDTHWKSVVILIAPFLAPLVRELVPRLRKAGSFEFEPVPLEDVAKGEKPDQASGGVVP